MGTIASPADMQAKILACLLNQGKNSQKEGVEFAKVEELLVEPLLRAFFARFGSVKLSLSRSGAEYPTKWWRSLESDTVVVAYSTPEEKTALVYIAVPAVMVSDLLALLLGGQQDGIASRGSRRLGSIERRLIEQSAKSALPLVQSLAGVAECKAWVLQLSDEDSTELLADFPCVVSDYGAHFGHLACTVSVSVPKSKVIQFRGQTEKKSEADGFGKSLLVKEIDRSAIRVDIVFRLAALSVEKLRSIRMGDIIDISPASLSKAKLVARGHEVFDGYAGREGQNYSFKILRRAKDGPSGLRQVLSAIAENGAAIE